MTNTTREPLDYGELRYDPNVEARYGPASRERMAALGEKLHGAICDTLDCTCVKCTEAKESQT